MPWRIYKNAIECKTCGKVIESQSVHDFRWCNCPPGSDTRCAVDGGYYYLKRVGSGNWIERSESGFEPDDWGSSLIDDCDN
jgi:hypothetical protein